MVKSLDVHLLGLAQALLHRFLHGYCKKLQNYFAALHIDLNISSMSKM